MAIVNCLRCRFWHADNGNCTAVGGVCTAVPAVHCPLLREYLDTELTPEEVSTLVKDWSDLCTIIGECGGLTRVKALTEADKDGRLVVLPCKVGDTLRMLNNNNRTCRLKLRRGDVADILIMIASHYDAGEKWRILHDEIKRQFDEQEAKRDG